MKKPKALKVEAHIPTQQYGYIAIQGTTEDLLQIEKLYNKYAERPLTFEDGEYRKILTFTNEEILYNAVTHKYKSLDGRPLISGSQWAHKDEKPFDTARMASAVAAKHGIAAEDVAAVWEANGKLSRDFGSAVHLAMELWFRHKPNGCGEKEYHIPKHPFLNTAVISFPRAHENVLPELMVSDLNRCMIGQIDGLVVTGEKKGIIIDYKTDARKIKENLPVHRRQLSFYASILQAHGWTIEGLEVWNLTDKWECYPLEVLEIIL